MPNLLIFDAFMLLICGKRVANYALLWCKTFSLKICLCKILDKYHVWAAVTDQFSCAFQKHFSYEIFVLQPLINPQTTPFIICLLLICEHSFWENLNSKQASHTQSGLTTFNIVKDVKDGRQLMTPIYQETFSMDDDHGSMILRL